MLELGSYPLDPALGSAEECLQQTRLENVGLKMCLTQLSNMSLYLARQDGARLRVPCSLSKAVFSQDRGTEMIIHPSFA